ncbi:hypothetical protein BH11PSE2_BH11PSE2_11690 [soil metagenome]
MIHPYAKTAYVAALAGASGTLTLPAWGVDIVRRPIDGGGFDGAGPYPMTPLTATADTFGGLEQARDAGLVSLVVLPDPLLVSAATLKAGFSVCRPFKNHYLIDRSVSAFSPNKHHGQEIRRAERRCRIEIVPLASHLADWNRIYGNLRDKHDITGTADFTDAYVAALAAEPLIQTFAAYVDDEIAAMALWFAFDGVVYQHLAASSPLGYANSASYALVAAAVSHFGDGVINLGGRAGFGQEIDGLARFKMGFSNREIMSHICGAVLDEARYGVLSAGRESSAFFPAYRAPV